MVDYTDQRAKRLLKAVVAKRGDAEDLVSGSDAVALEEIRNEYNKDDLPVIPEGAEVVVDFAGDFGAYATAVVDGAIHRVKIELSELHKLSFPWLDD